MVLLKNEPVDPKPLLPIDPARVKKIVVVGPYADVAQIGDYSGTPTISMVTPFQGVAGPRPKKAASRFPSCLGRTKRRR